MADISQFKDSKTNTLYNLKDAQARADLLTKQDSITAVVNSPSQAIQRITAHYTSGGENKKNNYGKR